MATTTSTELCRCFAAFISPSSNKPNSIPIQRCVFEGFNNNNRFPLLSVSKHRHIYSSSNSNSGGLTYKDAGVDVHAGSDLVTRIAKMAPGIEGFFHQQVIKGIVDGCQQSDCVLLGGEVLELISKGGLKGIAHITGGGFTDNIPRVFPKGLGAVIYKDSWEVPIVFKWIQQAGRIEDAEMRRTFNMGIGMVLVASQEASCRILEEGKGANTAYHIGEVVSGEGVSYH